MCIHKNPRLSIGMPVYNGEKFIRAALDSLLTQTFVDFELIISDNASTDRTQEICEAYAAVDARIRYYRQPQNVGAAMNFNKTVELASGEYFKWSAHDDVLAPDYLQRCVEALDQNPDVVICHSKTRFIDENGEPIRDYEVTLRTDSPRPQDRFHDLLWVPHQCYPVFGVMRREALLKTKLIEPYTASDRVLLLGMSLFGRFYEVPEYLFWVRKHKEGSSRAYNRPHNRMAWFDPAHKGHVVLPAWNLFLGYWRTVGRAALNWRQRMYCYGQLIRWVRHRWHTMRDDLVIAVRQIWDTRTQPNYADPTFTAKGLMGASLGIFLFNARKWKTALLPAVAFMLTFAVATVRFNKKHT